VPSLLHRLSDLDGLDTLLQGIAVYRKKDVTLADEQVHSVYVFACICDSSVLVAQPSAFLLVLFYYEPGSKRTLTASFYRTLRSSCHGVAVV
jgi:hypothetical protein